MHGEDQEQRGDKSCDYIIIIKKIIKVNMLNVNLKKTRKIEENKLFFSSGQSFRYYVFNFLQLNQKNPLA